MSTIEVRTWIDPTAGWQMKHEMIWWKTQTPAQVRDTLYPGVDMKLQVTAHNSTHPGLAVFCNSYTLVDNNAAQLPSGRSVSLIELP